MITPWVLGQAMHYSDFRIFGFEFFRIFAICSHNIDPRLMKFGMNDLQLGTEIFNYLDVRISWYPVSDSFGYFHFTATILTLDLWNLTCMISRVVPRISTIRISRYAVSDIFNFKSLLPASEASHVYFKKAKCRRRLLVSEANLSLSRPKGEQSIMEKNVKWANILIGKYPDGQM